MKQKRIHNINETGFKVPENYFNNLEYTILSQIKLKDKVADSGFKVPNDYFDTLEDHIFEKASEKNAPKVISLLNRKNLIYLSGVAAAIILFFSLSIFKSNPWNSLDTETVENYIIEENLDSYDIATLFAEEDLSESNFLDVNFDEDNIETYLLNHLDTEDLIIE